MFDLESSKTVYAALSDDRSRFIYEKRCMLSLTDDVQYEDDIIYSVIDKKALDKLIEYAREVSDKLVIRGTGNEFNTLIRLYPDLEYLFFVDRDPFRVQEGEYCGHRVVSTEEFYERYDDFYVLICSSAFASVIVSELQEHGIPRDHILNFGGLWKTNEQYFDEEIIKPVAHEVFVDGGCYDGTTARKFASWCQGEYDAIYSYEPDGLNYNRIVQQIEKKPIEKFTLFNKGLWDKSTTLYFNESGGQGSGIICDNNNEANTSIETTTIDGTVIEDNVTFIKLDVEGAEYEAIVGASETIAKNHPRMAISIYHKPEDIFELPRTILEMCPDYKLYIRHYQMSRCETILYAV